jgi:hypothetical protein
MMPRTNKAQTGLIEANLPLYVQCLRMPAEWHRATNMDSPYNQLAQLAQLASPEHNQQIGDLLVVCPASGEAQPYDPWEKRSEFFRLPEGDTESLLAFLRSVGYFQTRLHLSKSSKRSIMKSAADGLPYFAEYESRVSENHLWGIRRLFENSVRSGEHSGKHMDFPLRIVTVKGNSRLIVTTTTFEDALALTLSIDAVRRAKRRKCARPDCAVPFTFTGGHRRKYCGWYCGHIESVRKSRKRAKKAMPARKER